MVRATAISWQIGLAVAALGLPLSQTPALADTTLAKKVEKRNLPLEPKAVRVILMPPASDTPVASPYPEMVKEAPVILVRTVGTAATAVPNQDPAAPIMAQPAEDAIIDEPQPDLMETARFMLQPAGSPSTAQPRPEPAKIPAETEIAKEPSLTERRPPAASPASPPPVANAAATASPPREPATTQNDATLAAIPALPRRSPFRQTALQTPFKSEFVENAPLANGTFEQSAPAKSNSPLRFLTNLWPGNKRASAPAESSAPTSTASASQPPANAAPASGDQQTAQKPNLLDKLQFWKN